MTASTLTNVVLTIKVKPDTCDACSECVTGTASILIVHTCAIVDTG